MSYGGGIFDEGCKVNPLWKKNACDLDHGVVAVGYTADYWLIRNSWGGDWGEAGYIRLTRSKDNMTFTDVNPQDGDACRPYPKDQHVMGESGVLFDTAYPTGVRKA